jgi:hypothetical protein
MTRRHVIPLLAGPFAFSQASCAVPTQSTLAGVMTLLKDKDLTVLWAASVATNPPPYFARDVFPGRAGRVSVAPDAKSLAWAAADASDQNEFLWAGDSSLSTKAVVLKGHYPIDFAVADSGQNILALAGVIGTRGRRLINLSRGMEWLSLEITRVVAGTDLGNVEKMSISGAGDIGVVSVENELVVLDLKNTKVLLRQPGRYGSISPDGTNVAFIDSGRSLMVRSITGGSPEPVGFDRVQGVAAWSPDGRYLLASAFTAASFWKRLIAVDVSGRSFCELARIREGDDGSRSAWVSRSLTIS